MAADIFNREGFAAQRQRAAQSRAKKEEEFGWEDFLTKILLPVGLGIATGLTGGLAAPAAAGVIGAAAGTAGAVGAGLTGAASGMAAGSAIGAGIEDLAEGNTGPGVGKLATGLVKGVAPFVPTPASDVLGGLAGLGSQLPSPLSTQLEDPSLTFGASQFGSPNRLSLTDRYNPLPPSLRH